MVVQIAKCICTNHKMYLYKSQNAFLKLQNVFLQITKCIFQIQWEVWLYVGSAWLSPVKGNTNTCHLLLLVVPHRFHHLLRLWLCCLRLGLHRLQRKKCTIYFSLPLDSRVLSHSSKIFIPGMAQIALEAEGGGEAAMPYRAMSVSLASPLHVWTPYNLV